MSRSKHSLVKFGVLVLLVLLGSMLTAGGKVSAEPFSFDFTFTCSDTIKVASVNDTIKFFPVLTNTGSEADSYWVTLTENPPTPEEWWVRMCVGGVCRDSLVTSILIWSGDVPGPLPPGESDYMELHVLPRTLGQGHYLMTVESGSSPGVKLTKSINFRVSAYNGIPLTRGWGLFILTALILTSGLYLIYRRLKPVRHT